MNPQLSERANWYVFVFALTSSLVVYAVVGMVVLPRIGTRPDPGIPKLVFQALGVGLAFAAVGCGRSAAKAPVDRPDVFKKRGILCLGLAESTGLVGLLQAFLTGDMKLLYGLVGLGLAVVVFVAIPAGNAYFRRRESPAGGVAPIGPS